MAIITLSRELGSLGTVVADMLCTRLGCAKLDKQSLEERLRDLGMPEPGLAQDEERKPGFWEQLTLEKVRYLDFMKAAIYRFAEEQGGIIIGRGANVLFRGVPGTLKLRVIAPLAARTERLRERLGIDEVRAAHMIRQSDHDRAGYHRYFFDTSWDCPADYDLVINTGTVSPEATCDLVAGLLQSPPYAGAGSRARAVLRDRRLAQDVIIAIAYRQHVPVLSLDVVCDSGVVTLAGTARTQAAIDQCTAVARGVEGVSRVVTTIEIMELGYYPGI